MHEWRPLDSGSTIGRAGSEGGSTVRDEEHTAGARITLEREAGIAPFAITCGVYGWMVHTRFFESEDEASAEYERMKTAIAGILSTLEAAVSQDDREAMKQVYEQISALVRVFP